MAETGVRNAGWVGLFLFCLFSSMLRLQQPQPTLELIGYSGPGQEVTFDPPTTLPLIKGHAQLSAGSDSASRLVRSIRVLNWSKEPEAKGSSRPPLGIDQSELALEWARASLTIL